MEKLWHTFFGTRRKGDNHAQNNAFYSDIKALHYILKLERENK